MRPFVTTHLPTILWILLTGGALLAPGSELDRLSALPDWAPAAAHFLLFLGLALLLGRSLLALRRRRPLAAALLLALLYGLLLEVAQLGIQGRAFEWQDLVLNGLGALAGAAGAALRRRPAAI